MLIPLVPHDCDGWYQIPQIRDSCLGTEAKVCMSASAFACISFCMHQFLHAGASTRGSPADIYDGPILLQSNSQQHHYVPFALVRLQDPAHVLQKLQAVDLYCGCGGMSFIDQKTDKVQIKTQWAVDSVEAMCQSFQVNYPDATVGHGAQ